MDTLYMRTGATNPLVQTIRVASLENKNNPIKAELSWQWCRWAKATKDSLYWSRPLLAEAELSHRNKAITSPRPSESTTFDPADLSNWPTDLRTSRQAVIAAVPWSLETSFCSHHNNTDKCQISEAWLDCGPPDAEKCHLQRVWQKKRWIQLLLRPIYSVLMPKGKSFVQQ